MNTSRPVLSLSVSGMSCEGCAKAVKRLVLREDPQAEVDVDLSAAAAKIVSDQPSSRFTTALTEAGYPAQTKA